jgi:5'-3' exonuclease
MSRLAIIDGDILCYKCFPSRYKDDDVVKLDSEGFKIPKEFTKEEDAKYLMNAWESFQGILNNLLEEMYCTDYLMAVDGRGNYRKQIFPDYKMHRGKHRSGDLSKFVPQIRKLAVHTGLALPSDGREADDLIRIWAEESRAIDRDFIIASIDKDLLCIPGKHYHIRDKKIINITPEQGCRLTYEQLLKGDPVDNIPGLPGMGPVGAEKALADANTIEEFQEIVVGHYLASYGDDWKEYLLSNGKLLHLQREVDDYFDLSDWPLVKELEE